MASSAIRKLFLLPVPLSLAAMAVAQFFLVQCPTSAVTHHTALHSNNFEPSYSGLTRFTSASTSDPANEYPGGVQTRTAHVDPGEFVIDETT